MTCALADKVCVDCGARQVSGKRCSECDALLAEELDARREREEAES